MEDLERLLERHTVMLDKINDLSYCVSLNPDNDCVPEFRTYGVTLEDTIQKALTWKG
jgi:hypothetical protein